MLVFALAPVVDGFSSAVFRPACGGASKPTAQRAAIALIRLQDVDAEAADGPAADGDASSGADASSAAGGAAADGAATVTEEVEEEEDLLSTPAFLKQKLKVLEKEETDLLAKTEEEKAKAAEIGEEWQQKRTRLQTDFDNFKARHVNQTLEAQLEARIKLLQEFLPVLDNFDRARASINPDGVAQSAADAQYQELHANLMATLTELGMEKIDVIGTEFDYNVHMAIQQIPSDEYEEGIVCAEVQPGYMCKGSLLRAAYVMVSSGAM